MAESPTKPVSAYEVVDAVFGFDMGVNTGMLPSVLPPNQLANAVNCTVRGGLPSTRPVFVKRELDFGEDTVLQSLFETGRFQGAAYYQPDDGRERLLASIGGYQFAVNVNGNTFSVANITTNHTTVNALPARVQ